MVEDIFVGLGSNLGDSEQIILNSWRYLAGQKGVEAVVLSSPFLSAPVDMDSNHWFTNAVGKLSTSLDPHALLSLFMDAEKEYGRTRDADQYGYQDRMIDLDLLFYSDIIIDEPKLTLPHPRFAQRLFVLAPMVEIAPDFSDPVSGATIAELHRALEIKIERGDGGKQEISRGRWSSQI
jgi:2-amino-4-hydroxy-6-hydroxymethyldihydropteridine diphosphokinase